MTALHLLLLPLPWAAATDQNSPLDAPDTPTASPVPLASIHFGRIEPPVVAQQDITVRFPTSNQKLEEKPLECSGLIWHEDTLILTSDRHQHAVFTCRIDLETLAIEPPKGHVIIRNEQNLLNDAESIAISRHDDRQVFIYVLCSQSNDRTNQPFPQRRHMLRFELTDVDPFRTQSPVVLNMSPIRDAVNGHFKKLKIEPYRTYYGDYIGKDKNTYRWGNIEGMTFAPDSGRLICGMRNPFFDEHAICFAVDNISSAFDQRDASQARLSDMFSLNLQGRGVNDLRWDPVTQGYLIAAGKSNGLRLDMDKPFPPRSLDIALFWWSGHKSDEPVLFARCPDMNIDALCRLGTSPYIAICSDEGDVSEGREQRQSVLTIMEFTGIPQP